MIERIVMLIVGYILGNIHGRVFDYIKGFIPIIVVIVGYLMIPGKKTDDFIFLSYYFELGIILGHYYQMFRIYEGDDKATAYWGVITFFTYYTIGLTYLCLIVYWGEKYVTGNVSRAVTKLILVFTIGFIILGYFGYYGDVGVRMIEADIIIVIMGIMTYLGYRLGKRKRADLMDTV